MADELMLTSKQRSLLRGYANTQRCVLSIGREGITEAVVKQAWDALEARELVKVTVQPSAPYDSARQACDELCGRVHAEPVQVIGSKFALYRPRREKPELLQTLMSPRS